MILANDIKLLTKNGLREWSKPNIRFYLNESLLTKGFDYKTATTELDKYSIGTKDRCFELFDGCKVLTSRGYTDVADLDIGDTLIIHSIRQTDYGATSIVLLERKINSLYVHKDAIIDCIEVPYQEIIIDGLQLKL